MTLEQIIQRIQSGYSKGVQSDDTRLSSRHIYNKLLSVRNILLTQKSNKKQRISESSYQVLPCIRLITAPAHECPCLPPVGCEILKTEQKIPRAIMGISGPLIQYVSSVDGQVIYSPISIKGYAYKKGNKFTQFKPDYFEKNNHYYITTRKGPKAIAISQICEDPIEAANFKNLCDDCTDCQDCTRVLEMEFPIDGDLIEPLIEISVIELIDRFNGAREDNSNNGTDQEEQQQPPRR